MSFSTSSRSAADVLACLPQGGGETLVLGDGLGELALGLEDLLLEGADALGCVLEPAAEHHDFLFQGLQLSLELADLAVVLGEAPFLLGSHVVTSWVAGLCEIRPRSDTTPRPRPAPCHVS